MEYYIDCNDVSFTIIHGDEFIEIGRMTVLDYASELSTAISWERLPLYRADSLNNVLIALSGPVVINHGDYNIVIYSNVNVEDCYDIISVMDRRTDNLMAKFLSRRVFDDNYVSYAYDTVCKKLIDVVPSMNTIYMIDSKPTKLHH